MRAGGLRFGPCAVTSLQPIFRGGVSREVQGGVSREVRGGVSRESEANMRAEVERLVEEIKQSVGLLRRHL
jgi:hypothetical protein